MKQVFQSAGIVTATSLAAWLMWISAARTQEVVPPSTQPDQGIEVLNEGPVHEAYAAPVTGQPQPGPIVPKQPPAPVDEVPPDQKPEGNNVQWIPGYWQWDDQTANFLWVSGFWRDEPPDRQWVPGFWNQVAGGWQWVSGYWADARQQEVSYLPPPPPSIDSESSVPPPNPDDVYVPGVWVYIDNHYRWRPGFFVNFNPNWVYTPAHYVWCPAGYVFLEGYWDYALENRGLLFAPVLFDRTVLGRPNWTYTPQYVVSPSALVTALFVRPAYSSYYFGDYFDPSYARRGFIPWVDYHIGRTADPLFTHQVYRHRNDPTYARNLGKLYAERRDGKAPRPPRTVREAQGNNAKGVSLVAHLQEANAHGIKLQTIPKGQLLQERKMAQQMAAARTERQKAEVHALGEGGHPVTKPGEQPRTAKMALPRVTRPEAKTPAQVQRPALPRPPQHVAAPVPKHEPLPAERASHQPVPRAEQRPPAQRPQAPHPPEARPPQARPPEARSPTAAPPQAHPAPPAPQVRPQEPPHPPAPRPAPPPPHEKEKENGPGR